jgi:prevent-host-death family protein
MKKVSIQDLKAQLSSLIDEAEAGAAILVTRHGTPAARLGPARGQLHRGARANQARLRPAIRRNTQGRYLAVLDDDRGNR